MTNFFNSIFFLTDFVINNVEIMIRIFIIHLDTFLSIPAALQNTNKQLHVIVWLPRAGFCTENKKHDVIAPLTGRLGFNGPRCRSSGEGTVYQR